MEVSQNGCLLLDRLAWPRSYQSNQLVEIDSRSSHETCHTDPHCMHDLSGYMEEFLNDYPWLDKLDFILPKSCQSIQLVEINSKSSHETYRTGPHCKHDLSGYMEGSQNDCLWLDKLDFLLPRSYHSNLLVEIDSKSSHETYRTGPHCMHDLFGCKEVSQSGYLWLDKLDFLLPKSYHNIQLVEINSKSSHETYHTDPHCRHGPFSCKEESQNDCPWLDRLVCQNWILHAVR
jgi:hypothetical protein